MKILFAALCILGGSLLSYGQGGSKVVVRAAMFPGAGVMEPLHLFTNEGGGYEEVNIWGRKFSPEFTLPRMDVWRFGHWKEETNEQGKTAMVFHERGRVKPPASGRIWLIFFREKLGDDAPLTVQAIAADNMKFKEGGVAVINLTKHPVGVQIAETKARVNPGGRQVIDPGTERKQSYPVHFYYPRNGKPHPFVMTKWFHGERLRRLALVIPTQEGRAPKLLVINDLSAREEPKSSESADTALAQ